ncbi:MAG TPA: hypothetical protein PLR06_13625, partial [Cyclobacteriaceae bacterium]|nr:hypothetical protein [Cyclobacteriaceae bacterium]
HVVEAAAHAGHVLGAVLVQLVDAVQQLDHQLVDANPAFLKMVESRAIEMGHAIGVKYGEGFTSRRWVGVKSLDDIF